MAAGGGAGVMGLVPERWYMLPVLPMNITVQIALYAACADAENERAEATRLACTCQAWFRAMYAHILLPRIVLRGDEHVRQFATAIDYNKWGLRELAARCTRHIVIEPAEQAEALYDAAMHARRFATSIYEALRIILHHCTHICSLYLHAEPKALTLQRGDPLSVVAARAALQEVVCLQSPWAGDTNDTLWLPSGPGHASAPWSRLTHLQLHGPRFRMTPRTAASLATLPALSHLALITPYLVDADGHRDAFATLQTLLDTAPTLQQLLLVGHNEPHWVGAVRHWQPALSLLERPADAPPVTLTLVTAAHLGPTVWDPMLRAHASLYSNWMLARAKQGTHWSFLHADDDPTSTEGNIAYQIESWQVRTRYSLPLLRPSVAV